MQALATIENNHLTTLPEGHGRTLLDSLLNREGVNWYEIPFGTSQEPVPVIARDSEEYRLAQAEIREIESNQTPVMQGEMAAMLYRLQGHYWQPNMTDSLAKSVAEDYARLLGEFPASVYRKACDDWLLNPENKFFPKVGELKALLESTSISRKWRLKRLKKLVEKAAA